MILNDWFGRRPLLLGSAGAQSLFLWAIAGLGFQQSEPYSPSATSQTDSPDASTAWNNALVAFIILFGLAFCIGWAPLSYLISSETPSQMLRDKTTRMGFATGIATQFVVAFTLPYLQNAPYANLGMKIG